MELPLEVVSKYIVYPAARSCGTHSGGALLREQVRRGNRQKSLGERETTSDSDAEAHIMLFLEEKSKKGFRFR